jgi:hypothetical protein
LRHVREHHQQLSIIAAELRNVATIVLHGEPSDMEQASARLVQLADTLEGRKAVETIASTLPPPPPPLVCRCPGAPPRGNPKWHRDDCVYGSDEGMRFRKEHDE